MTAVLVAALGLFINYRSKELFKTTISQGVVGTFTQDDLPILVTSLLSDSLFSIDQSGKPVPRIAKGFEVNDEANEYKIFLREDYYWVDGSPLKSSDFDLAISDAKIEVPDEKTILIKLADSFSPLPSLLTKPIFKKNTLIGTGPYKIQRIEKDKQNMVFIEKIMLDINKENYPKLTIKFYPNEKVAKTGLKMGEIQSIAGVNDFFDLSSEIPFKVQSKTNYSKLVAIFYNTMDPILSDRNFRIALSYGAPSIKNEALAKTNFPPTSWAFNADLKSYLDNPDQAKQALKKVKNGKDSTITLTATVFLKEVGEKIVSEWKNAGINAILRVESGIPQDFQALLISQDIPSDPDQYAFWHSTQTQTNTSKYFSQNQLSPRVDKDLEDGRKSTNEKVRKERYFDLQKVLLDDAPATFLYFPKYNIVYLKKIEEPLEKVLELQLSDLQLTN